MCLFTLSDNAARQSGNARRKPGTGFSGAITGAWARGTGTGVKKTLSSVFSFFLKQHASILSFALKYSPFFRPSKCTENINHLKKIVNPSYAILDAESTCVYPCQAMKHCPSGSDH